MISDFSAQLNSALLKRAEYLERTSAARLKEFFDLYMSGVSAVYTFLTEKGPMQSDPYKKERTVTEIQVPSSADFSDSEAMQEVGLRFSRYVSQWEFLANFFHITLSNLNLRWIKDFVSLLEWIRWNELSPSSQHRITRFIAASVIKTRKMSDPMTGKIVDNAVQRLRELTHDIKIELKTITVFLRERYKWGIRTKLMEEMTVDADRYSLSPEDVVSAVKREFSRVITGIPWYRDLIIEILDEDFSDAGPKLREQALKRLQSEAQGEAKKIKGGSDERGLLLNITQSMARAGEPIRVAVSSANENLRALKERKRSFSERIAELFSSMFGRDSDSEILEIPMMDGITGSTRNEVLNMSVFTNESLRKARVLAELQDPRSQTFKNVRKAETKVLIDYIENNITAIKTIHRRLAALNAFFHSDNMPEDVKPKIKASSLSIKNLKSVIAESLRGLHEYRTRSEAELRKMGIGP